MFAYQIRQAGESEVLRQSDDLLELLHWLEAQHYGHYEVREQSGLLLAVRRA